VRPSVDDAVGDIDEDTESDDDDRSLDRGQVVVEEGVRVDAGDLSGEVPPGARAAS
jgi:hypothetical protein